MSVAIVRIVCMSGLLIVTIGLAANGGYMGLFLSGTIGCVLIYMLVISLWISRGDILAERVLHQQPVQAGDQIEVTLAISLPARYWLCWMVVEESWVKMGSNQVTQVDERVGKAANIVKIAEFDKGVDEQYVCLAFIRGARNVKYHYTTSAKARGLYRVHSSQVIIGDMFGLVKRVLVQKELEAEIVQVNPAPLAGDWIERLRRDEAAPSNYGTIRDYMNGDPISSIDWKSYARYQKLKTKQLEVEVSKSMLIVMDARKDYFETIVSAVTRIVKEMSDPSLKFILVCGDSRLAVNPPYSGLSAASSDIYEWLARVEALSTESFDGQLRAALDYSGGSSIEGGVVIGLTASPDTRREYSNDHYGYQQSVQLLYIPHNGNGEMVYA